MFYDANLFTIPTLFVVQLLSHIWLFATPRTAPHQALLYFPISQRVFKLMSVELVMLSSLLILCQLPLLLPSIFPNTRIFSRESALHIRWPKYWIFSNSPFNGYPGLISFRTDFRIDFLFDLLAVQGTLKSLLQHHGSNASVRGSGFFSTPCTMSAHLLI